jgi:2-methylcitrate dehydratase PrpD
MTAPVTRGSGVTRSLAEWAARLRIEDVPPEVLAHIKLCVLDALGCALFGAEQEWSRIAAAVAAEAGTNGPALLFASPDRASAADAAMANGTAVHGYEIDDVHVASSLHPAAAILPAALALAETRGADGADFILGLIAGYEIGIRAGIAAGVQHSTSGFHVTGTVGAVGAAAAAGKVLGLDASRLMHAIAVGTTQAAGLYAARIDAMAKRFHAGRAAQSGVIAALLAEKGFTGSREALEAPFGGFFSTMQGQHAPESMLEDLGIRWEAAAVGFKVYAACASAHTTVDAVLALRERGLRPEKLKLLTVDLSRKGWTNVGWPYVPGDVVAAQMNGSYAAAVALLDGDAFLDQYRPERLADPRILDLITRITLRHDPALDAGGAAKRHAIRASAEFTDGTRMSVAIEQRLGSRENPIPHARLRQKFRTLAGIRLQPAEIDAVMALADELDRPGRLTRLLALLSRDSRASATPSGRLR